MVTVTKLGGAGVADGTSVMVTGTTRVSVTECSMTLYLSSSSRSRMADAESMAVSWMGGLGLVSNN